MNTPAAPPAKKKGPILLIALIGMCVLSVPCIGVVSAVAIPSFINYVRRSKTAEADSNLAMMAITVESYCREMGTLPGRAGPLPAFPGPEKQVVDFSSDPVFAAIGFSVMDPIFFSYAIEPNPYGGSGVTLVANGDLDGDGLTSRFSRDCDTSCICGPMVVEDELE